jgi:hypothetical protein
MVTFFAFNQSSLGGVHIVVFQSEKLVRSIGKIRIFVSCVADIEVKSYVLPPGGDRANVDVCQPRKKKKERLDGV